MYDTIASYFKSEYDKNILLYGKCTIYEPLEIKEEILFNAIKNQSSIQSKQICFGVRIGLNVQNAEKVKPVIIFERIEFSIEQFDLINKLLTSKIDFGEQKTQAEVFFINCKFRTPIVITEPIETNVCFRDCVFSRDCAFKNNISGHLIFTKCNFNERFDFEDACISQMFFIENCYFDRRSIFNLTNAEFTKNAKFTIKNSQFVGRFEAKGTNISSFTVFSNITFFHIFNFNKTKFNGDVRFDNIAFAQADTKQVKEMMMVLSKELFKKGFETEIKNIGLNLPCDYEDSDDYESSLKTGLINTKYAARYLGKSVSYLAQKRKKDKEITTRDSIPFIGSGKNISYPVDALKAYKYHNWDELKKLRQKYKNKED